MTKEKILSRVLDILELGRPNMEEFSIRLQLQKIIYLLQASGLSLGYGFNWYVRGPYSPDLAQALFEIYRNETLYEESKDIKFKNHDDIIANLENFKDELGDDINNITYLEVLASLHYINKVIFSGKGSFSDLIKRLLEAKPSLKAIPNIEATVRKAYDNLSNFT